MLPADLFFWVFAGTLAASAAFVVVSRNPVHAVFFLILAFLNAAALFILLGAEFLGMIMLIVYVGAVAVLFLFVVMTLDTGPPTRSLLSRMPAAALAGAVLLAELALVAIAGNPFPGESPLPTPADTNNTLILGRVLYTDYVALFELAGAILLVAMVGAIALAHRRREGVHRQRPSVQVERRPKDSVTLTRPEIGAGVSETRR